ncbi:G patch domain and ankyrin repeat-containing protein 1 homolog isoform X2 [Scaptodrosophila lebanonensis]|nr:G patch domain and ankyrin repeat-containing protein 1 homolog isoform X2 [Scaptodrosophila lebanonensis]
MSISSAELNVQDSYGWTALMMAACEGADTIAAWLLEMGADIGVADKSGHTALTLARRKGHAAIVELLEKERNDLEMEDEEVASEASEASVTPFYCDICQRSYCESTWRAHQTSTVHQFNANPAIFNKLQKFNISTKNRGLRIMVKQGWDREHGLGPQQNGRLYPIKTVLRKERNGLGIEQSPARVTHFSAFDTNATKRRNPVPREQRRTRNDMQREKVRERKRERRLRNELS